ncbi:MAG: phosphoribosylanthranilate isomerase [Pseudoflavonifractor sp.]|nr:phosphoribosylanthranilate isomerase [Alloprevotella sp.]MCM1116510.1 phosphoribosylanthranilate isomerase [Pseudoflavonifractor sp.]
MKLKIKVCGMRDAENIRCVASLGPDYMGFILYPRSPRFIGKLERESLAPLLPRIVPVAVSVGMEMEELMAVATRLGIGTVQLHGDETPGYCQTLRERGLRVWKAISLGAKEDAMSKIESYLDSVDMLLFDTATTSRGGSGQKFDWGTLERYTGSVPFMLAGGIGPGDEAAVQTLNHPMLHGIDLNSRFERAPGIKDTTLLSTFLKQIKK